MHVSDTSGASCDARTRVSPLDMSGATSPDALANLPHNAEAYPTVSEIGDTDLRSVIAAWPTLPEQARAQVLAIVAEHGAG